MKHLFVIAFCLWANTTWVAAEEFDLNRDDISSKYSAGAGLIYDCTDLHWACVTEADHQACHERRESDQKIGRERLDCLPAVVYQNRQECHQAMQSMINGGVLPRECLNRSVRSRFIGFQ